MENRAELTALWGADSGLVPRHTLGLRSGATTILRRSFYGIHYRETQRMRCKTNSMVFGSGANFSPKMWCLETGELRCVCVYVGKKKKVGEGEVESVRSGICRGRSDDCCSTLFSHNVKPRNR